VCSSDLLQPCRAGRRDGRHRRHLPERLRMAWRHLRRGRRGSRLQLHGRAEYRVRTDMERMTVDIEWKAAADDDGTLEGYASTFGNVDLGQDVVEKGAFLDTI